MARVVLVSSEPLGRFAAGGITTFVHHFGSLLLDRGDEVTWIVADPTDTIPDAPPETPLARAGARVVHVRALPGGAPAFVRASAAVAEALPEADVVYLQDWGALGLVPVRSRRLLGKPACPLVTVLHSTTDWIRTARQAYPARFDEDTALSFAERYVAEHSDLTVPASEAMRRWLIARGWRLDREHVQVLGLPFLPHEDVEALPPAPSFSRIVFFGRLQTIKGLELFVEAVERLAAAGDLRGLEEVVLLGAESENRIGGARAIVRRLEAAGVAARAVTSLDSVGARTLLTTYRRDSLVVVPSLVENLPYTVIEASSIPGLNLLCSNVGGIPEILRDNPAQLFAPHVDPLATALRDAVAAGPLPPDRLSRYDAESSNGRWLALHESVVAKAPAPVAATPAPSIEVVVDGGDDDAVVSTLVSLERQATPPARVTVLVRADASAGLRERLERSNWALRAAGPRVGASRNTVAADSQADYLLFLPAGAVARPHLVATLAHAAARSGADALVSAPPAIEGGIGALPVGGGITTAIVAAPFRAAAPLVRRTAFAASGGYATQAWLANLDDDLLTRLAASGHDVDVVPEILVERWPRARVVDAFRERDRMLDVFRGLLAPMSLTELPEVIFGADSARARANSTIAPASPEPPVPGEPSRLVQPAAAPLRSIAGRSAVARLMSEEGWETAGRIARTTPWRIVMYALVLKLARPLRRGYVAVRSK